MKHADIQKLHEAGLITGEQRQKIIGHFQLKEDWNAMTSPRARATRLANSPRRLLCPRSAAVASRKCLWTANPTPRR
jgi:hypothetical protein